MSSYSRLTASLGASLLAAMGAQSFSADKPLSPSDVYGPRITATATTAAAVNPPRRSSSTADTLRYWNQIAIDASGVDHTPVAAGENRVFGEQLGPGRSARAMAIVHIAMFDAVNAITGGYRSYTGLARVTRPASLDAAIATAAHHTLIQMFPSQAANFDALYAEDIARIPASQEQRKTLGVATGRRAATRILALRSDDGWAGTDPRMDTEWISSNAAGHWRQDPISQAPIALGAHWGEVKPFVMRSPSQFRVPPPPAMTSAAYTAAYDEVKRLGGDGVHTPTERSADQTHIGIFWGYDGTPSLCAPPRLYNQIATEISKNNTSVIQLATVVCLAECGHGRRGHRGLGVKVFL